MDNINESAEERLTSLESSQMQIQKDLKAFQIETGDSVTTQVEFFWRIVFQFA